MKSLLFTLPLFLAGAAFCQTPGTSQPTSKKLPPNAIRLQNLQASEVAFWLDPKNNLGPQFVQHIFCGHDIFDITSRVVLKLESPALPADFVLAGSIERVSVLTPHNALLIKGGTPGELASLKTLVARLDSENKRYRSFEVKAELVSLPHEKFEAVFGTPWNEKKPLVTMWKQDSALTAQKVAWMRWVKPRPKKDVQLTQTEKGTVKIAAFPIPFFPPTEDSNSQNQSANWCGTPTMTKNLLSPKKFAWNGNLKSLAITGSGISWQLQTNGEDTPTSFEIPTKSALALEIPAPSDTKTNEKEACILILTPSELVRVQTVTP